MTGPSPSRSRPAAVPVPSPQVLRRNIWRGIQAATDQEIRDGLDFYPGAHGLCRLFALAHSNPLTGDPLSARRVAGIYAALSPMNGWDSNVANVLDVLRLGFGARVNTTHVNLWKALAILHGADPDTALGGPGPTRARKVRAFYRGIADPADTSPIPIDRHLICLALGRKITDLNELRDLSGTRDLCARIEDAYRYLGDRERVGNRLASIAWFVQRRIRSGQIPVPHPGASPRCPDCARPMSSDGWRRYRCRCCDLTQARHPRTRRPEPVVLLDDPAPGRLDVRGEYPIVYLPAGHPARNSGGWQYLARWVVMEAGGADGDGAPLRSDEHVHHVNGDKLDCRRVNLEVWLAERHGHHHAKTQILWMGRDVAGRFLPSNVPAYVAVPSSGCRIDTVPF